MRCQNFNRCGAIQTNVLGTTHFAHTAPAADILRPLWLLYEFCLLRKFAGSVYWAGLIAEVERFGGIHMITAFAHVAMRVRWSCWTATLGRTTSPQ